MYLQNSKNLSIYLNNVYNCQLIFLKMITSFNSVYNNISTGKRLPSNIKTYLNKYPIYYDFYPSIKSLKGFNTLKIREITYDSTQYLISRIRSEVIVLKEKLDKIPLTESDITYDISFQNTYISNMNSFFNKNNAFLHLSIPSYSNYFFYELGTQYGGNISNTTSTRNIVVLFYLIDSIPRITNVYTQWTDYFINSDIITSNKLNTEFGEFIDQNIDNIINILIELISKNVYQILDLSDNILLSIKNNSLNEILKIKDCFQSFINNAGNNIQFELSHFYKTIINHVISIELLERIADPSENAFNSNEDQFTDIFRRGEEKIIYDFLKLVNPQNLKDYLFLSYQYKFWPIKYLNILSIITKKFTEEQIFLEDKTLIDENLISSYITSIKKSINFNDLSRVVNNNFDFYNIKYLLNRYNVYDVINMLFFIDIFDKFLASKEFQNYLLNTVDKIHNLFVNEGLTTFDYSYFDSYILIKLYLKVLFRRSLLTSLFSESFDNIKNSFNLILDNVPFPERIENETLIGVVDGTNSIFRTKYQFDDSTFELFNDNVLISSNEYELNRESHTVFMITPPPNGSSITSNYNIYYPLTIDFNETIATEKFDKVSKSKIINTNCMNFITNFLLGSITKHIYVNLLDFFKIK